MFILRYTAQLILIVMFLMGSAYAVEAIPEPPLPTPVGRVVWVKGELRAVMPNKEERILQKSSVIYLHDTLTTDSKSQGQVVFTDDTLMTFRPDTKFYIDQYSYQPKKKGSVGKYIMRLIEGGFRTITGIIAKNNPSDYSVNTPVATIGVRGTDYAVYFKAGEMFINHYSGTPCVTNQSGSLCLSEKTPYAHVPSADSAPVPLAEQPAVFQEKLEIVPAKIGPFEGGGPGTTPAASDVGKTTTAPRSVNGPLTSFCITQ